MGVFSWILDRAQSTKTTITKYGKWMYANVYANSRYYGWIGITTIMLTFLPLFIETAREAELEVLEQQNIEEGLAKGITPFELRNTKGLEGAVDPDVISKK